MLNESADFKELLLGFLLLKVAGKARTIINYIMFIERVELLSILLSEVI